MVQAGVYVIENTMNGNIYVGSAVNLRKRKGHHFSALRRGDHHNPHMQRTWDKYGKGIFKFSAKYICEPEECLFWEQCFIDAWEPEYNICPTAGNVLGRKHSAKTKAKMSAAAMGHTVSKEVRAKLSAARKGKKLPPRTREHRDKISASQIGNKRFLGKKHSQETRAKMSASATKREARKRQRKGQ